MQMTRVVSENVAAVGYEEEGQVLRVQFRSGGTYDYRGVAKSLYQEMLQPHPWRRVGPLVKRHPFIKRV